MKTLKCVSRFAITATAAAALTVASTGVASATEMEEPSSITNVSTEVTYTTPSAEDIALYRTSDPETIYLLNQMSEEFDKYGNRGAYDGLATTPDLAIAPGVITTQSWSSFASCVGNGLAKSFGIDILKRAFNKEVRSALKSRQWKVASSIMHRNISKYLGRKAASIIIKKIASKALPGGLPGQIAWQIGKCGIKEIW